MRTDRHRRRTSPTEEKCSRRPSSVALQGRFFTKRVKVVDSSESACFTLPFASGLDSLFRFLPCPSA